MAGGATVARRYRGESRPDTPLYTMAMTRPIPPRTLRRSILVGGALPLILAGCQPIVANRGNMLDEDRITQVKAGSSSKNDVFEALGSPSITSTFDDNTWYYVGQRTEREAFFKPVITDRKIIAVQFDDTDHVKTVDRVGLEEAVASQELPEHDACSEHVRTTIDRQVAAYLLG